MHDYLPKIVFYIFAFCSLLSAVLVIFQNNPVRAVLFLIAAFFFSSGLWILAQAEFLALILVLVYVGAVMTLFLFIVMMLNIDLAIVRKRPFYHLLAGVLLGVSFVGVLIKVSDGLFISNALEMALTTTKIANTNALGLVLYTKYVLAFEMAAVILLVAIISAVTLVIFNTDKNMKRQNILSQLLTTASQRLTLHALKTPKNSEPT